MAAQMAAFQQLFNGADQAVRSLEATFGARLTNTEQLVQHVVDEVNQHKGKLTELVGKILGAETLTEDTITSVADITV